MRMVSSSRAPGLNRSELRVVDLGVFLVPEDVAAFVVEKHDALRQDVDRLAQPLMRFARLGDGGFGLGARARDLGGMDGRVRELICPGFGRGRVGRTGRRVIGARFCFFDFVGRIVGINRPVSHSALAGCRLTL